MVVFEHRGDRTGAKSRAGFIDWQSLGFWWAVRGVLFAVASLSKWRHFHRGVCSVKARRM